MQYEQINKQTVSTDDIYGSSSAFLKAEDFKLPNGKFGRTDVKISDFEVVSQQDGKRQIVLFFEGKDKKLGLNKTNAERIGAHVGSKVPDHWKGWTIRLIVEKVQDPSGRPVDSIRVSTEFALNPQGQDPFAQGTHQATPTHAQAMAVQAPFASQAAAAAPAPAQTNDDVVPF